ncbi:MAG TPA: siroheme synthase CysG [Methyloceanibacter sp.]|jgi:uroporphyrin-III C-methyltransferase / precorrin-2 dehydrogenase / sirohydrochlorin ferrochelatase|nr:siroheme synthase CysG [Methyloceanibacter sp.]
MRTFPIFVSFDGKPPLVVGGGELAAVKTRLLLMRAPSVDVAADEVTKELTKFAEQGLVTLIAPLPGIDQLRGRPLVIAATENDETDSRVSAIARALGVPVNVPDRPELCSFALPAIVDRGEVTVAIGTSAAAPVLAQRLRAWLERELHPRLDALARLAGEFRGVVAKRVPTGPTRRKFWEAVFEGAAAEAILEGDEAKARALIDTAIDEAAGSEPAKGRVLLVGAGPGDPELLTMKAIRALKAADVVLYDRLVGDAVLEHARREAELIPVGKAKGAHSLKQAEINALLIKHASAGKAVVRLKGGDPFIFGRGGEELDALREAGIAVEIVPGVTAGIAAAASLQIPLTHRDVSRTVTFLSGHEAGGEEPSFEHLDLAALAGGKNTLLVYMGVSTAGAIAKRLLDAGFAPTLPVLAVENASRDDERRVLATVADVAGHPERLGLKSPAVLIFGEVAGLPASGIVEDILALEEVKRRA